MSTVRNTLPLRRFFTRKAAAPLVLILALAGAWVLGGGVSHAQLDPQAPPSLKVLLDTGGLAVPEPPNLSAYVKDKQAAIRLGKALFWDMQVGSDGKMACASCHFHAGADSRDKNQLNPALLAGDTLFGNSTILGVPGFPQFKPNYELQLADFPFHRREDPERQRSNPTKDTNDIVSSQGVVLKTFTGINPGSAEDLGTAILDPVFNAGGATPTVGQNLRRVEPVNAPSVINAVFNLSNFLNGRAHHAFNGEDPHGPANQTAGAWYWDGANLVKKRLDGTLTGLPALTFSSLASQATGPPLSDLEMSWRGRTWPQVGKKMLSRKPLALQAVHHDDSVFGDAAPGGPWYNASGNGLSFATYEQMVQAAFQPEFYSSTKIIAFDNRGRATVKNAGPSLAANEFTQMMVNFPLIFGLSVQLYQATLVSDQSRFDQIMEDPVLTPPTPQEVEGAAVFFNEGKCNQCHAGSLFTNAAVDVLFGPNAPPGEPVAVIELMTMFDRGLAIYDTGFYNIGVRPTGEDIGRGGNTPFKNPANKNKRFPLSFSEVALLDQAGKLPVWYDPMVFLPDLSGIGVTRTAVNGALKTPSLRNVELTGPYFRNGGAATLMQTVEFYVRGADFPQANHRDLDAFIAEIPLLIEAITPGGQAKQESLVAFLLTLTDERVRNEQAPFDHPAIEVPYGHDPVTLQTTFITVPEVGAAGNAAPLKPFLFDGSGAVDSFDFHKKPSFP